MKWFLLFVLFIMLAELVVNYQAYVLHATTRPLNYLIGIIESIFYGYIFYHMTSSGTLKRSIQFFVPISVIAYCIGYFFISDSTDYFIGCFIGSGFFLATISLAYLYVLVVNYDEKFLIDEPGFWLAIGISLFYSGTSICFVLWKIILVNDLSLFGIRLYNFIPQVLCVVLYSCMSICLILCKKKSKISF